MKSEKSIYLYQDENGHLVEEWLEDGRVAYECNFPYPSLTRLGLGFLSNAFRIEAKVRAA